MRFRLTPLPSLALAAAILLHAAHPAFGQEATPAAISQLTIKVQSGTAPIAGASVQVYQADLTSDTATSTPLLPYAAYTDANGVYTLSGLTCSPGALYYLAATGGDTGSGANPAIAMMTAIGSCTALSSASAIVLNEVTTVASVYALSGFMTTLTTVGAKATPPANASANDTLLANNALSGITNAFATANNLVDITTGIARTATIPGNGTVPQAEIDTLANALAVCIESSGFSSTDCTTLIADTHSRNGAVPVDTVQATLNIARNPSANVAGIFALAGSMTPLPPVPCNKPQHCTFAVRQTIPAPYGPTLTAVPHDFSIVVSYTGGGITDPTSMAIDASGNVWIMNFGVYNGDTTVILPGTASVIEFANNGALLSGSGYKAPFFSKATSISIDQLGDAWVAAYGSSNLVEFSPSGSVLLNYMNYNLYSADGLAIDGSGSVLVTLNGGGISANVTKFANNGTLLGGFPGYPLPNSHYPYAIAIDQAGASWTVNWPATYSAGNLSKLDAQGNILSGQSGFTSASLGFYPEAIAIDSSGDAWVESKEGTLTEFSSSGNVLSGNTGYPTCVSGGTVECGGSPASIAIDGAGNLWAPISYEVLYGQTIGSLSSGLAELNPSGVILSGPSGYANDTAIPIGNLFIDNSIRNVAIDNSGNVWSVTANNIVREVIGAAVPVVTPLSAGVKTGMLGSRP